MTRTVGYDAGCSHLSPSGVRASSHVQEKTTKTLNGGERCGVDVHRGERVWPSSAGLEERTRVIGGGLKRVRVEHLAVHAALGSN